MKLLHKIETIDVKCVHCNPVFYQRQEYESKREKYEKKLIPINVSIYADAYILNVENVFSLHKSIMFFFLW